MSSYRSYTSWSKGLGSSVGSGTGTSGYSGSSKSSADSGSAASQYDSYGSRRYGSSGAGVGSVATTSAYRPPPVSYRSPYVATGARDRSSSREKSSATAALIDKYGSKEPASGGSASERLSLRDKYNFGTYPGRKTAQQQQEEEEEREREREREAAAAVASSSYRSLGRSSSVKSRDLSPEPAPPDKLYGSSYGRSYSSYGRASGGGGGGVSYSRSVSRDGSGVDSPSASSSSASTPATTPVQIPTSLRFGGGTTARYGVSVRSPVTEKPPSVFGLASSASERGSRYGRSYSTEEKKPETPTTAPAPAPVPAPSASKDKDKDKAKKEEKGQESSSEESSSEEEAEGEAAPPKVFITVVTRGTSPTPPSTSPYLRSRRADLARVLERTVAKRTTVPETADKEVQSDRGDDTARLSRYGGTSRASPYLSSYLDRYSSGSYSSRYSRYGSYGSSRSDREPSVSTTKSEGEPAKTDPPKPEPEPKPEPKSVPVKQEPPKPEPAKIEIPKNEPPKTDSVKVTVAASSSPLPSKESNKSTNKFPFVKEQTTKEPSKPVEEAPSKVVPEPAAKPSTKGESPVSKSPSLSRSGSVKSLASESPTTKSPSVSRSDSTKNMAEHTVTGKLPNLSRSNSLVKSITGKPPIGKTESSGDAKTKSPSSTSVTEATVTAGTTTPPTTTPPTTTPPTTTTTKTPPLSPSPSKTLAKAETAASDSAKPPVPKAADGGLRTSSSLHALATKNCINKDFRKSPLNVEQPGDAADKKKQLQRGGGSSSLSSSDAEATAPPTADSKETAPSAAAKDKEKNEAALRLSKSLSKLATAAASSNAPNFLEVPKATSGGSPKRQSPVRTKSRRDVQKSPSRLSQHRGSSGSDASSSDSSTSSSESSSESSTSSSEDSDTDTRSGAACRQRRRPGARSSGEDLSLTADKPPRPPGAAKAAPKTEEAKSFLMRALAPVTNLFRRGQDVADAEEAAPGLTRAGSTASLRSDKDVKSSEGEKPRKRRIRKVESGERAWWLDDSAEVPEGILRLQSNKSLARLAEAAAELKKSSDNVPGGQLARAGSTTSLRASDKDDEKKGPSGVKRLPSNKSIAKLAEAVAELQKSDSKGKLRIRRIESGERAWWLDGNANIPEGIQKILSSSSLAADAEAASKGLQKIRSSRSVAKMVAKAAEDETPYLYRIRHVESGEKAWWLSSCGNIPDGIVRLPTSSSSSESSDSEAEKSGKKSKGKTAKASDAAQVPRFPLILPDAARRGSTTSAHESDQKASGRQSPYDNVLDDKGKEAKKPAQRRPSRPKNLPLFIGSHTNIDDILGSAAAMVEPAMGVARLKKKLEGREPSDDEELGDSDLEEVDPAQVRVHDSTAQKPELLRIGNGTADGERRRSSGLIKLDDAALQLYKDGDYGSYLDLEASLSEQQEELEGFQENRKNSIVLRTQLSVRVHTIIEKLLNSEGRELRRALFSLKQIFQEDKDLVHEFVQNDGLACLIKVGSEADQNYQNYILRALGQVMLYVDGMNGVMEHNQTVQWLYTLIASKYRLVVKTALKLLLVFVEYVETNCLLLIRAVRAVDKLHGTPPWSNIMKLLKDYDSADTELLIYATSLVNKTLNGIPDQDTYYDQVDALEEQGMEGAVQRYMSKQGTDLDLLRQLQIYEAVLHHEDGEDRGSPLKQLDENIRKTLRNRKSLNDSVSTERRKSRRHSTGTAPLAAAATSPPPAPPRAPQRPTSHDGDDTGSSSSRSSPGPGDAPLNGAPKDGKDVGVTPALRRRRERAERQRSFIREQQETAATLKATLGNTEDSIEDENQKISNRIGNGSLDNSNKFQLNRVSSRKDMTPLLNAVNSAESEKAVDSNGILKKPWVLSMMYGKNADGTEGGEIEDSKLTNENGTDESSERKMLLQLKRENTVKDLTQKLSNQNILHSPVEEGNNKINRIGDMTGLISKAKEGLAKSKSKADVTKSPTGENVPKLLEVKKSETELHWEELVSSMKRPLSLCDLDFTDLKSEDEVDVLSPTHVSNGVPPPPPPVPMAPGMPRIGNGAPPPPPPVSRFSNMNAPPPPMFGVNLRNNKNVPGSNTNASDTSNKAMSPAKKTKKTVKLFWKEVRDDPIILAKLQKTGMIWDELSAVSVDTQKLEHLFESRAKDLITKKQQEMNKNKEIIVLDHKRSNAINIGMTKLPPPRSIKTAILKMDATVMNREGIEKLLTMLPTEEERAKIQEAQMANPDLPLGSAEQFLLTLASISELPARLKLWAFKLDYENSEKEIAEPLMDLKQGMETLKSNKTFRGILSTLLSIGIFLNGNEVKGFQIEYLAKVPEVKDTVHKHSLLHHLCHMVMEKFPDSSDLYSEIGAVTRASKVDFDELAANILKMEQECKASWDHLKVIAKHDGSTMKVKMSDFLADCAERIIVLGIVHRRVMNRFHKFLLWLGIPLHRVQDMKPNEFCRIVSEFALEYRTTRERVLQQLEKKANHRERNKTRGKMITEVGKFRTKEDRADAELRQLLGSDISDAESIHGTLPWRRQRKDLGRTSLGPLISSETVNGNLTDGDDEILESLVKTATKAPATRTTPRERKRTRHADRKSLKRSRTRENNILEGNRESP